MMTSAKDSVAHGYTPALDEYTLHPSGLGTVRKVSGAARDIFPSLQEVYGINLDQNGTKIFGYTLGTLGQPLKLKEYPFKSCAKVPFAHCTKAVQHRSIVVQYNSIVKHNRTVSVQYDSIVKHNRAASVHDNLTAMHDLPVPVRLVPAIVLFGIGIETSIFSPGQYFFVRNFMQYKEAVHALVKGFISPKNTHGRDVDFGYTQVYGPVKQRRYE
jgi:hypothetical protein